MNQEFIYDNRGTYRGHIYQIKADQAINTVTVGSLSTLFHQATFYK